MKSRNVWICFTTLFTHIRGSVYCTNEEDTISKLNDDFATESRKGFIQRNSSCFGCLRPNRPIKTASKNSFSDALCDFLRCSVVARKELLETEKILLEHIEKDGKTNLKNIFYSMENDSKDKISRVFKLFSEYSAISPNGVQSKPFHSIEYVLSHNELLDFINPKLSSGRIFKILESIAKQYRGNKYSSFSFYNINLPENFIFEISEGSFAHIKSLFENKDFNSLSHGLVTKHFEVFDGLEETYSYRVNAVLYKEKDIWRAVPVRDDEKYRSDMMSAIESLAINGGYLMFKKVQPRSIKN
ncbi:hypothetical protein ENBRE01_1563 [Enteropsectra breve]|nr:hypothetical protein ENBRE01_1563 [Enteropsectra breve]